MEALTSEREALWARLERASFLTIDEKRAAAGYGPTSEKGTTEIVRSSVQRKYSPDQPRTPAGSSDGGRWVDAGGGEGGRSSGRVRVAQNDTGTVTDAATENALGASGGRVELAQARGGRRDNAPTAPVTIRGVEREIAEPFVDVVQQASIRRDAALARLRELDPEWSLPPSLQSTGPVIDIPALLSSLRSEAQMAEARLTVIARGGLPLAFSTREEFHDFGQTVWRNLNEAGYKDALPYLRGSSVTGYNYSNGRPFDEGRLSDLDIAIVSPRAFQRASEIGVPIRGGSRTRALRKEESRSFGYESLISEIRQTIGRDTTIVIYRSFGDMTKRGPYTPIN